MNCTQSNCKIVFNKCICIPEQETKTLDLANYKCNSDTDMHNMVTLDSIIFTCKLNQYLSERKINPLEKPKSYYLGIIYISKS